MPRYAKGDYVVHPGQGVCEVDRIVEHEFNGTSRLEYELYPAVGPRMRICFPVSNEDALRPVVARREAQALVAEMPTMANDAFCDPKSWAVEEHFRDGLRHGDCRDALRIAKTMHDRMERERARGKRPKACYERIFKEARERALVELGVALGRSRDEVDSMIEARFAG